jgi:glutamate dehydrogenase
MTARRCTNILGTFPRDELFQIGIEQLQEWTEGILDLETRPRVRVFARIDRFDRFVSVLVYVPRDRYATQARARIGALLADAYRGRIAAFYPYFPEGPLVRVQFIVGRYGGETPHADVAELERKIEDIVRTWEDRLADAICAGGGDRAEPLLAKYGAAFSAGYAETFSAERALQDIERIERLGPDQPVVIDFHREPGAAPSRIHAAVYSLGAPIPLSERVPVLENLGFSAIDERSYHIRPRFADGERDVTLHDMVLETSDGAGIDLERHDKRLEGVLFGGAARRGRQRRLQRLIVSAGADWREAAVAQGLCRLPAPARPRRSAALPHRHADPPRRHRPRFPRAVSSALRSRAQDERDRAAGCRGAGATRASTARSRVCRASTRTASCARC